MEFITGFDKLEDIDNYSEEFQQSFIYISIAKFNNEALLKAIAEKENVNLRDGRHGFNYLHLLVSRTSLDSQREAVSLVYILSNAGIDINEKNFENLTPLQIAMSRNLTDIVIALIRCGAWPENNSTGIVNHHYSKEIDSILTLFHPGLWSSVATNDYMSVSRLLSYWCRVRICRNKQSLLLFARDIKVQSLIIEALENGKSTAEYVHATLAGDEKRMLDILSNKNVDIYVKDMSNCSLYSSCCRPSNPNGDSLKFAALTLGHNHILHLLPERKCRLKLTQISVDDASIDRTSIDHEKNKLARHSVAEFPPRYCSKSMNESSIDQSTVCLIL